MKFNSLAIFLITFLFCMSNVFAGTIRLQDEGTTKGYPWSLDCSGAGISCAVSASKGTITVPGGGTADIISEGNSNVEVIDAGTGQIDFDVDGANEMRLTATSLSLSGGDLLIDTNDFVVDISTNDVFLGGTTQAPGASADQLYLVSHNLIISNNWNIMGVNQAGTDSLTLLSVDTSDNVIVGNTVSGITLKNSTTLTTGKNFVIGTTQWNSGDEIDGTKIKDADYGDIDVSAAGAWTVEDDSHNHVITNIDAFTKANLETQTSDVADYAEADGDTWTGTHDMGGATVEMPNIASGDLTLATEGQYGLKSHEDGIAYHAGSTGEVSGEVFKSHLSCVGFSIDPGSWYDSDAEIFLIKVKSDMFPNGIIIDEWECSCNVDPDVEMDLDLKRADAWIGLANSAVIDVMDTTNGTSSEDTDANINAGAAVAANKVIYGSFGADPEGTCVQLKCDIYFHAKED